MPATIHQAQIEIDVDLPDGGWLAGLAEDVREGLSSPFKEVPPKYFYDERGSALFEAITELPEYYPTRAERAIRRMRRGVAARTDRRRPGRSGSRRRQAARHTQRTDGATQVTYGGRPLYYYVSDPPGMVLCHNVVEFGGRWLAVKPSADPAS